MKKLGLVGGIGPESTLDYYKGIIDGYQERTGSDHYPVMVIDSLPGWSKDLHNVLAEQVMPFEFFPNLNSKNTGGIFHGESAR